MISESVDDAGSLERCGSEELILEDNDWEENWMFRKTSNKETKNLFGGGGDPVTMLIPNPEGGIGPTIGDR